MSVSESWDRFEQDRDSERATRRARILYSQSGGFVRFLWQGQDDRRRDALRAYLWLEMEGKGGKDAFLRVWKKRTGLPNSNFSDLETRFRSYVVGLR